MVARTATVIVLSFGALTAWATESNTVPTFQLTADFAVVAGDTGDPAQVSVAMQQLTADNGHIKQEELDQSADDVVTFSVDGKTVQYDPLDVTKNVIPVMVGSEYTMNFKRFNGETYSSAITLPASSSFTAPMSGAVFNKSEAVTVSWNAFTNPGLLFIMSSCEFAEGDMTINKDFTAMDLKAGWASKCEGPFEVEVLTATFAEGAGFGNYVGIGLAAVDFSYEGQAHARRSVKLTPELHRRILQAKARGEKVVQIHKRP